MAKSQEKTLEKLPLEPNYQEKIDRVRTQHLKLSLKQLVGKYEEEKLHKDIVEAELETVNTQLEAIQQLILEKFSEEGLTSIKTLKGATLFVRTSVYPRVENKQLVMNWINKHNAQGMLMVSHTSLRSLCTERLEAGEDLPDGVEVFLKDSLSLRRAKNDE